MEYRKFKADYLFEGIKIIKGNGVLITDSQGKVEDIIPEDEAGQGIEELKGLLSPGFVNAHCHLELSHLKNLIPEGTGLPEFVTSVVQLRHFEPAKIMAAIKIAEDEMLKTGTIAVGDICNNANSLAQKESHRIYYYNFIETSGWNPAVAEMRFEKSFSYYEEFLQKKMKTSLVPHAPYSVSKSLWGKITPFFSGKVISIHNQETKDEDEFFLQGVGQLNHMYKKMNIDNSFYEAPGKRSLESYFENFQDAASVILVHNTFTTQEDLNYIFRTKSKNQLISFCLCINANIYIEDEVPPVELFLQNNCNLVVGTDSLASNHQLIILEELKTIAEKFPNIETEVMLQWATINGAKALQMDDTLGTFEKGKKPGIVLIENLAGDKLNKKSVSRRIL
ncbi:MAG: amidohydrolase family protein [Bacteroidota bacterium]|nr:amidohydrolase family protein [Bacteroidota bacterium]